MPSLDGAEPTQLWSVCFVSARPVGSGLLLLPLLAENKGGLTGFGAGYRIEIQNRIQIVGRQPGEPEMTLG